MKPAFRKITTVFYIHIFNIAFCFALINWKYGDLPHDTMDKRYMIGQISLSL